ncbi:Ni/Fe-hydrogenase cytochrome b subunit [Deferribacterales bacterium Es71-Z0220]|uniref:Ni/Fe-hydrogenase cytochrome b subunit n=1 Tax=Deferrivibrio essentukiensis TaxID=2880922 RepID=UPI001F620852|nr:Ni/Fe-hydrogenase cytochrome b subunit [Deferrivibrio essentukiensis]MCB4204019.1 Ni/Fe-hydrogenase cytochrome b subunit [Deferrivibrio essentukiensis]
MAHENEFVTIDRKIITRPFLFLLSIVIVGFVFIVIRYVKGIGAVSNLSDGYPWGIWIAYDVATGTAIACGGYAMAILTYITNKWKYHSLIRSALLTSLFGYGLAGLSVTIDLGRYWNMYNLFIPSRWQFNSVMFEVAMCVMAYTLVLFIEFLPAILEKMKSRDNRLSKLAAYIYPKLNNILIFFIVLGITLPTMHQSSLGSMMTIATHKLHPIWHTGFLPLLFLINCIYLGFAAVIFESILSSFGFNRKYEVNELSGVANIIPWLTVVWVSIRIGDLIYRKEISDAFSGDFYSVMFLIEFLLIFIGSIMLLNEKIRKSPRWLFITACLILFGGGLYRMNVYIIGFNPGYGWRYFPSFSEFMITLGIVAFEVLLYLIFVKMFPVLPSGHNTEVIVTEEVLEKSEKMAGRLEWQER